VTLTRSASEVFDGIPRLRFGLVCAALRFRFLCRRQILDADVAKVQILHGRVVVQFELFFFRGVGGSGVLKS
jgi:hypothetical protein